MTEFHSSWNEILVGEMLVCSLVGRALYTYPEKAWLQSLIDEDVFSETPFGEGQIEVDSGMNLLQKWSEENRNILTTAAFDAIESDYMHLFIGPKKVLAPPWESAYLNKDHLLFQKETLQVRNWYRRFHLQVENQYHEPDDQIGVEFSFLALLARLALEALEAKNQKQFHRLIKAQSEFIRTHPARWIHRWCDDVDKNARTSFFRGFALVAKGVIKRLEAILEIPAPGEAQRIIKPNV